MPNVLVRNLSESVHAALQRKAERHHQSLQQYLTVQLSWLAERQQLDDVLDAIEERHGGRVGLDRAVEDLAAERDRG
jgi:antitoxin FitA